jgi:hypothetical protein
MKKMLALIAFLFLINGVCALSIDMKDTYYGGENILAEISGNILEPVTKGQIEIKRNNVLVPLNGDIKNINEKQFFWAIAPNLENNYTLYINNITTNVAGEVKKVTLVKNFSVLGNFTDYSVTPGVIFTTENFSVSVFLYDDMKKTIEISFPYNRSVKLDPGTNKIDFNIDDVIGEFFGSIQVGKYSIPTYIKGKKNYSSSRNSLEFRPMKIQRTVYYSDTPIYAIEVINTGNNTVDNFKIYYDKTSFYVSPENFFSVRPNQAVSFNVSLRNLTNESFDKRIYAVADNINVSLPITINITSNATLANLSNYSKRTNYYCSELNGIICSASESCSLTTVVSLDGTCCTGKCLMANNESSYAWVGYLLGVLVLVGLGYLMVRYKKKGPNGKEVFERKVAEAQRKMP